MKKIIIAICGVMLACGAMAVPDRLLEPHKTQVAAWWDTNSSYSTDITDFYTNIADEFADDRSHTRHGTWDDEGAIIIWAAREIYEHGAKFCPVQIQAANENRELYVWLDYYWNPDDSAWKNCITVCTGGFTGDNCAQTDTGACPPKSDTPYSSGGGLMGRGRQRRFINLPDWKSLRREQPTTHTDNYTGQTTTSTQYLETGDAYRHTTDMITISYENGNGSNDSDRKTSHVVLGVVNELINGVKVAPIKVIGQRSKTGGGIKSWINSAKSNGYGTLLCYKGYKPNADRTDCELSSACSNSTRYCRGVNENDFKSSQHIWTEKEENGENCMYFVCKSGYGLKPETEECISCASTRKQGINTAGICEQCDDNQIFNNGDCVDYKPLYAKDLIDGLCDVGKCWMESNPTEYSKCVFKKWDSQNNKCE